MKLEWRLWGQLCDGCSEVPLFSTDIFPLGRNHFDGPYGPGCFTISEGSTASRKVTLSRPLHSSESVFPWE